VLHTTETRGVPGYKNGALAPHLTFWPAKGTITQHTPFSRPAEAVLAHDDDQILQVEIVCYSSQSTATSVGGLWVGALTDAQLEPIAAFVQWVQAELPVAARWPERQAFNASQANAPGFRYTLSEFRSFDGILGHQHIPDNTHWDPGAFPWERFLNLIGDDDMPLTPEDILKVARAVWADEPGVPIAQGGASAWQTLSRTKADTAAIKVAIKDLEELTADEIAEAIVAAGVGPAVADELAARLNP
jgi:hypothetical protein